MSARTQCAATPMRALSTARARARVRAPAPRLARARARLAGERVPAWLLADTQACTRRMLVIYRSIDARIHALIHVHLNIYIYMYMYLCICLHTGACMHIYIDMRVDE